MDHSIKKPINNHVNNINSSNQTKLNHSEKKSSGGLINWFNKKMDALGTKMQHAQWFNEGDYKRIANDRSGNGIQYLREQSSEIQQKLTKVKNEINTLQIDNTQAEREILKLKSDIKSLTKDGEIALTKYNNYAVPIKKLNKDRDVLALFTKPNTKISPKDLKMAYTIVTGKAADSLNPEMIKKILLSSPEHRLMNHLGKINNKIMQLSAPLTDLASQGKQIDNQLDKLTNKLNNNKKR